MEIKRSGEVKCAVMIYLQCRWWVCMTVCESGRYENGYFIIFAKHELHYVSSVTSKYTVAALWCSSVLVF